MNGRLQVRLSRSHSALWILHHARLLLPPEATAWSGERLAAAVAEVEPLLSGSTSYGRMLKAGAARGERLPRFQPNQRVAEQLDAYRAYKEGPVAVVPRMIAERLHSRLVVYSPAALERQICERGPSFRFGRSAAMDHDADWQ